ncbi:Smi1p [Sugiyamaella lignohabitans]|uniref:Smi1p n=1 Tax=Sugiyamaella lignohabitans TaxID=796027 RepID=A0A167F1U3_9ASCO|nr:Smi1p [Sugiyamaella lignohabitans]ANB14716.1 Smi1p [Sugiyamaella lignohabitans]
MDKIFSSVQSFLHSVTTNDRYASYESQYRSSPNGRGPGASTKYRRTPLGVTGNSVHDEIDGGSGSGTPPNGQNGPYGYRNSSSTSLDGPNSRNGSNTNLASSSTTSLNRGPYTPGMRSAQMGNGGNIPLQDYSDGIPAPPAAALSWKRIDRWVDANYPELYDQLSYPATSADLNELESDLDCTLPLEVRDSYMVHDGQERGGRPTGLFFNICILDLEGIVEEWTHWKNTAIRLNNVVRSQRQQKQALSSSSAAASSSSSSQQQLRSVSASSSSSSSALVPPHMKQQAQQTPQQIQQQQQHYKNTLNWIQRQESVPEGAIQPVYAHPAWIPLAKDFEGNNIAVDLAPGKKGRWGQVILFGRDFDRKYVIAPSWGAFLASFADDLEAGDHSIDEDLEEGSLMFRAPNGRLIPYFDVLKSRVERSVRLARKQQGIQSPVIGSNGAGSMPGTRISRPSTPGHHGASSNSTITNGSTGTGANKANGSAAGSAPGRNLSSPKGQNLISPFQSTTNLATPTSEPSESQSESKENTEELSEPAAETKTEDKPETKTDSEPATKSNDKPEPESKKESEADENPETTATESTESKKDTSASASASASDDEVDMLEDELTEVQI